MVVMTLLYSSHSWSASESIVTCRSRATERVSVSRAVKGPAPVVFTAAKSGVGRVVAMTLMSSRPVGPPTRMFAPEPGGGISTTPFAGTRVSGWCAFGNRIVVRPEAPTLSTVSQASLLAFTNRRTCSPTA